MIQFTLLNCDYGGGLFVAGLRGLCNIYFTLSYIFGKKHKINGGESFRLAISLYVGIIIDLQNSGTSLCVCVYIGFWVGCGAMRLTY